MLALQQAYEVKVSIIEYLKATYSFQDKTVEKAFLDLVTGDKDGMFKGPYISLKLPYKKYEGDLSQLSLEVIPPFRPFIHQAVVFDRLSTKDDHVPKPTILTTGTASGKTEAFLYPLLDYCLKHSHRKGIKAIILYPMNALATDQAQRIAEAIHSDDKLRDKITAGLFIGEGQSKKNYPKSMGEKNIIESRESILDNPPDIVLTNFKMLDYALMRSKFHKLWQHNFEDKSLMKFLVLDELHTYDGAQGTDVANLIRRLKLKLDVSEGQLCPVGTSATIGSGEDSKNLLAEYATKVFGETFTEESIIGETRISADEFFAGVKEINFVPTNFLISQSRIKGTDTYQTYIQKQMALWGINPKMESHLLGEHLKQYKIVRDLLRICNKGVIDFSELIAELIKENKDFGNLPSWSDESNYSPNETLLRSILTLISEAKVQEGSRKFPLLYVQVQMWVRELSGILRLFQETPKFSWKDSVSLTEKVKALPPYFCRECGTSGWATVKHDNRNSLEDDISDTYQKYFSNHKNLYFTNVYREDNMKIDEYTPSDVLDNYVDKDSFGLFHEAKENRFKIISYRKIAGTKAEHICPLCNTRNTIAIIGTKTATLSSISVSQVISSDLDIAPEKERKVLAFTNAVQDAAHQAGFIEARNYRFTFRASMQRVLNELDSSVSLSELQEAFKVFWKKEADESGQMPLEGYLYKFFPPDHLGDVKIINYKKGPEKFIPDFIAEFDRRIDWEIVSEFGYNATIGRTLEKTGSSGSFFRDEDLLKAFTNIEPWLHSNSLGTIGKNSFVLFLQGFLHRLRIRGGIDHPYLNKFRTEKGDYFNITKTRNRNYFLIKNFGKRSRLPKFISDQNLSGLYDFTIKTSPSLNWAHAYFRKSFPMTSNADGLVNEFYTQLLNVLSSTDSGVLDLKLAEGIRNFSINADKLYLNNSRSVFDCDTCKHQLHVSANSNLEGAACIAFRCQGHYVLLQEETAESYYRQVYNRQRSPRIYATEHTGILERIDRERKEYSFKQRPFFNSLNALVATSTLEMGINIGDLNTTFNNSIPPLPSNYIQRIGRAGRSSGSALIVNFATNDAHDQYYYQEPKEMMQGEINSPGCYLEAKDILKRHFLAFCIDEWTKSDPRQNVIPPNFRISPFNIEHVDLGSPDVFVNRLLGYVRAHENELFERFVGQIAVHIGTETIDGLRHLIRTESFYRSITSEFSEIQEEVKQLRGKQRHIQKYIEENKLGSTDEIKEQLSREHKNIAGTIFNIFKRSVLEHLTNVGLLPNYAFPETGVMLNAQIRNRNLTGVGDNAYIPKSIELVRPAKSAIRELVPDNLFYTQGYKLRITGLNVISWKEEAIDFRFCSKCDHVEVDSGQQGACPKCGDFSYGAVTNKHKFVKLKAVKSFNDESTSTLDDSTEDREEKISRITRHFQFHRDSTQGAWAMKEIPFAIEYFKEVDIYEMNCGLIDYPVNRPIKINETEINIGGYITCKHCGKSSSDPYNTFPGTVKLKDRHYVWCKKKDAVYADGADTVFEEVYLYRQLKTEAFKILLPVQEFESESMIAMFKSGIELGLKHYYKGNPQHIEIREYKEYNKQTSRNDRFLVLYDVIPGGTGYLAKLFSKVEFTELIKQVYLAIKNCSCQTSGKDGCYHCIYTYGNQFEREELSRKKAEELYFRIHNSSRNWDFMKDGLSDITNSGQIEESELEEKFIKAIKFYAKKEKQVDKGWRFNVITEDGVVMYQLTLTSGDTEFDYVIRPQVELGTADGIEESTRADFMVVCTDMRKNGLSVSANELARVPSIAIYLDGYHYHASKQNNRFTGDLVKRQAIIRSGRFIQWTLSWEDMTLFENEISEVGLENDELRKKINIHRNNFDKLITGKAPTYKSFDDAIMECKNNMSRFLYLLSNLDKPHILDGSLSKQLLFPLQLGFLSHSFATDKVDSLLTMQPLKLESMELSKTSEAYSFVDNLPLTENIDARLFFQLNTLALKSKIVITDPQQGWDKKSWENFWCMYNLWQFMGVEIALENEAN